MDMRTLFECWLSSGSTCSWLPGQQLHDLGEDLGAVLAREAEGELGHEQAVLHGEVVAAAADLEGEVALAFGEFRQRR